MNLFRKKNIVDILAEAARGDAEHKSLGLVRSLGVRDLTSLGIAAIIGAGIFSTIGNASFAGGPAVSLLFAFTAIACTFTALCYAEFASAIPIAGSAYTYAYASFGELVAWLIGWSLVMEYAISNIAVAISWSGYFTELLRNFGVHLPEFLTIDYLSAARGHTEVAAQLSAGKTLASFTAPLQEAYQAWEHAPRIAGFRLIGDVPALVIVGLITWLVYVGVRESKRVNNVMVVIKLAIVVFVIGLGAFFVNTANWVPFAPNGLKGVMGGVSAVFFAYIGFDAMSTTAEECKNPQRDLPRAMIYSLVICTVLYVLVALVLTGMVPYTELRVDDPLAYVFSRVNLSPGLSHMLTGGIAVGAVIAITAALLVYQLGQPRIWMTMSRDGLLPKAFGRIHPRYRTPSFATIVMGLMVAVPSLFLNLTEVTDLTSIGTLFAFVLVCAGVLSLQENSVGLKPTFRVPYLNGKYLLAALYLLTWVLLLLYNPAGLRNLFYPAEFSWTAMGERLPLYLFFIIATVMVVRTWRKNYSLIPVLGMLSCFYLMTELHVLNWVRFLGWLLLGAAVYFGYSYRHSKLNAPISNALDAPLNE